VLDQAQAQAVSAAYRGLGAVERAHLVRRLLRCPFDEIAAFLPRRGDILDLGCGFGHFGVWLVQRRPGVRVWGCDPDPAKIAVARRAEVGQRLRLYLGDCRRLEELPPRVDGVAVIDVLYLMPPREQEELLSWAVARLRPGGRLVIKTVDPAQGVRSLLALAQEWIMVHLLRRTLSSGTITGGRPPRYYAEFLERLGLSCRVIPLPHNPTPAALVAGVKERP